MSSWRCFADELHRARLRAGLAFPLCRHVAHQATNAKVIENPMEYCITVKIDFNFVVPLEKAVVFSEIELGNSRVLRELVMLDLAPLFSGHVLKLTPSCTEGVAKRDVNVLVGVVLGSLMTHHDLVTPYRDVDMNAVEPAVMGMPVRRLDHHVAVDNRIVEFFQLGGTLLHPPLDSVGGFHLFEGDSDRLLHGSPLPSEQLYAKFVPSDLPRLRAIPSYCAGQPAQILRVGAPEALVLRLGVAGTGGNIDEGTLRGSSITSLDRPGPTVLACASTS